MVTVDLPYPPSANRLWRSLVIKGKLRMLKSKPYQNWLDEVRWVIYAAMVSQNTKPTHGPYGLTIQVGRKDKRRRDIDNFLKPISDALQLSGCIKDDCDCECLEMRWQPGLDGVRVMVMPTKRRE